MKNGDIPPSLLALETRAKVVLQQMGDGTIATVVASLRPPAVAEATEPATILLVLCTDLLEEREERLLGRLLAIRDSGDSDGLDGRIKSGVVCGIELGLKADEIKAEVSSLGFRD